MGMNNEELAVVESTTAPLLQQADVEGTVAFFDNYQDLTTALLSEDDYQNAGNKKFKKKSAWRKYGTAFNLSDHVVEKEIIRDDNERIISARYEVEAVAPNGRRAVGVGACSIFDKLKRDDTVEPSPFELRKRFSNAEHDVISTAHTRAKNRAIADIIGTGEVTADEVDAQSENGKKHRRTPKKPSSKPTKPKTPKNKDVNGDVIETTIVTGDKPAKKSLQEISKENNIVAKAIKELQATESPITFDNVKNKLVDLYELEKITIGEYRTAKELLE